MSATKKPLTFDIQRSPATPTETGTPGRQAAKPAEEPRQQVGARIRATTYRQLKARAALTGATVQELVEKAITEFLKNHPA
jgi:hypothetical protein